MSFFEAYAAGANFDRAVMTKASLEKMQAYAARFREADLRGVHGIEAGLMDCNFERARLEDVNFTGALLGGAAMSGVNICGSKLTGAYSGADLRSAIMEDVSAYGVTAGRRSDGRDRFKQRSQPGHS